jgi:hypothetical protein
MKKGSTIEIFFYCEKIPKILDVTGIVGRQGVGTDHI